MSNRHGYSEDLDELAIGRWRGAVNSAIRGKRGQALLKELLEALDAMPDKALIAEELQDDQGDVCALGCLGMKRGLPVADLDPEDPETLAEVFGVSNALIREIAYINDEGVVETPEERFRYVRMWVEKQIAKEKA